MTSLDYNFIKWVSSILLDISNFPIEVCDFIGCQFALESNYGKSDLAKSNHNLCGMRNPIVRISTAIHAGDGQFHWAQYTDAIHCIYDYLLCLQYHRPLSTQYDNIKHYSEFIRKFYCPEMDYIERINKIYHQFKSFKNE